MMPKSKHDRRPQSASALSGRLRRHLPTGWQAACAATVLGVLPVAEAHAGSGSWQATSGSWNTATNWAGGQIADGAGSFANFGSINLTADSTVTLATPRTIGTLVFGDTAPSHNWTLGNNNVAANVLTLSDPSAVPSVIVSNQTTTFGLVVVGTQGFTKTGSGTLTLGGTSSNTNTGPVTVAAGTLNLNKTNAYAVYGDLVVGNNTGASNSAVVRLLGDDQLRSGSNVTVNSSGWIDAEGNNNFLGSLTMAGGRVSTATASLTINGPTVTTLASSSTATISGYIALAGDKTFDVAAGTTSSGVDLNFGAAWSGGTLIKAGNGVMNLSSNTSYADGLRVDAGVVRVASSGALNPFTPSVVSFGNASTGTFRLNGYNVAVRDLSTDAVTPGTPIIENASTTAATLTVRNASDTMYAGVIRDGTGGGKLALTKSGTGTLTLSSSNGFTGGLTIDSGIVRLGNAGALNATTPNVVSFGSASTGTLQLNGNNVTVAGLSLNTMTPGTPVIENGSATSAALTVNTATDMAYAGVIRNGTGGGKLTLNKSGTGTLTLSGNNGFTGGLTIDSGIVRLGSAGANNSGNAVSFGIASTGTLQLNGNNVTVAGLRTNSSTPGTPVVENANATAATLTVTADTSADYAGVIRNGTGGALSLTINGGQDQRLSGPDANTFTGTTAVEFGSLLLSKTGNVNAVAGNLIVGNYYPTVPGKLYAATGFVFVQAVDQISDASNVTVNNGGRLDLFAGNERVGSLTLVGGNVRTNNGVLSTFNTTVNSVATPQTAYFDGNFDLSGGRTFAVAAGTVPSGIDLTVLGVVSNGTLTKSDNGLLNLAGNNTFTGGLTINGGVVRLDNPGALNSTTPNAVSFGPASTGTLRLAGRAVTVAGLSTSANVGTAVVDNVSAGAATLTVNTAVSSTYAGVLRNGAEIGALSLTKTGTAALTLAGTNANTFTGTTAVTAGTLNFNKTAGVDAVAAGLSVGTATGTAASAVTRLLAANQISDASNVTVNASGLFDLNGFNEQIGSLTLDGGNVSTGTGVLSTTPSSNGTAAITLKPGPLTGSISGKLDLTNNGTINVGVGYTSSNIDLFIQAAVSGGALKKTGYGVLNLAGFNTFTGGLTIVDGTVRLANAGALNSTTPNTVTFAAASTGDLRLNGNSVTVAGFSTDASTPGSPVLFNTNAAAATLTVSNGAANTFAGSIQDGGSGALSIRKTNTGTLTLSGTNYYSGATTVSAGTLVVGSATALPKASAVTVGGGTGVATIKLGTIIQTLDSVSILANGRFDLGTGVLFYNNGGGATNLAVARALVIAGYDGGANTGFGYFTSALDAAHRVGFKDTGTATEIRYTLNGDADLDGGVSINDFNALAGNFGKANGQTWAGGDFDYDGGVSINDFNLLAGGFGQSIPASSGMWAGLLAFAAAHDDLAAFEAVTGVPEPTVLGGIVAASMIGLRRRRRNPVCYGV